MQSLNSAIREVVEKIGDPLMEDFYQRIKPWSREDIREEVHAMVKRDELRMKDDDIDHDWTYRKGAAWETGTT